jgi:hypothetical protein
LSTRGTNKSQKKKKKKEKSKVVTKKEQKKEGKKPREWWDSPPKTLSTSASVRKSPLRRAALFEFNVPEHLPSSPMCPAHPKNKSGGKGVCVVSVPRSTKRSTTEGERGDRRGRDTTRLTSWLIVSWKDGKHISYAGSVAGI